MLPIIIAALRGVSSFIPVILVFLVANTPRNKNGTYKPKVKWAFWGAVVLGVIGVLDAGFTGTHDYKNDSEMTSDFNKLIIRADAAIKSSSKTLDRLEVANGAINKNIKNSLRQIADEQNLSRSLQNSLQNERHTINLASKISQDQQFSIKKQQSLLSNQKLVLLEQSRLLKLQVSEIATGTRSLAQLDRIVNPIQVVEVSYVVQLPTERPELADFVRQFDSILVKYLPSLRVGVEPPADCPISLTGEQYPIKLKGRTVNYSTLGIDIRPGTDLYSSLPVSVRTYSLLLLAWRKQPYSTSSGERTDLADMSLDASSTISPRVTYNLANNAFYLVYTGLQCPASKLTGRIKALPELFGAHILVKREMYDVQLSGLPAAPLTDIQKMCSICQVTLTIDGVPRIFALEKKNLKYDKDIGYVSSFVFEDTPEELSRRSRMFGQ